MEKREREKEKETTLYINSHREEGWTKEKKNPGKQLKIGNFI